MKTTRRFPGTCIGLIALFAGAATAAPSSHAGAPPANVGGTVWSLQTGLDFAQLEITHQGGPAGIGGPTCPLILGQIGGVNIRGWYCPSTGRIHFLHDNSSTGATVRTFIGNVTVTEPETPWFMSGTMTIDNAAFGPFGEYGFTASQ